MRRVSASFPRQLSLNTVTRGSSTLISVKILALIDAVAPASHHLRGDLWSASVYELIQYSYVQKQGRKR